MVAGTVLGALLQGGATKIALAAAREEPINKSDVLGGVPLFVPFFLGHALRWMGTTVGLALLLVPGAMIWLGTALWPYLVVDRNLSALAALRESYRLTTGHKKQMMVMYVCWVGLSIPMWMFLGAAGDIALIPLFDIALAWIYVNLTTIEKEIERLPTAS